MRIDIITRTLRELLANNCLPLDLTIQMDRYSRFIEIHHFEYSFIN